MSDAPRRPLVPLAPELRRRLLYAQGLDEDALPFNLSDEERKAAAHPGLPAPPKEKKHMPFIPAKYAAIAAAIATALAGVAALAPKLGFLPPWAPFALWCLASVAALLAGVAMPEFTGLPPALQGFLVPLFLTVSAALKAYAAVLGPSSSWQVVVLFLGVVADALGGKGIPQPQAKPTFLPPPSQG